MVVYRHEYRLPSVAAAPRMNGLKTAVNEWTYLVVHAAFHLRSPVARCVCRVLGAIEVKALRDDIEAAEEATKRKVVTVSTSNLSGKES